MGSFSRIANTGEEKSTYELFYDNKFFATSRINKALRALIVCLAELGEHAHNTDK